MSKCKVYGSSDDCMIVERTDGDNFAEEFSGESAFLAFSDGTVLGIRYDDEGIWRITPMAKGSATYTKTFEATDADSDYSDIVELDGDIKWVVRGASMARAGKETIHVTERE